MKSSDPIIPLHFDRILMNKQTEIYLAAQHLPSIFTDYMLHSNGCFQRTGI